MIKTKACKKFMIGVTEVKNSIFKKFVFIDPGQRLIETGSSSMFGLYYKTRPRDR